MKIVSIETKRVEMPAQRTRTPAQRASWAASAEVANPMSRYPRYKRHRSSWLPKWDTVHVKVTAEDGTWGLGRTSYGRPVAAVIEDHFAPMLVGENCFAIERIWDMMFRMSKPYGSTGIACCAMSAVDLALWDLVGKLHDKPVYELLGGPAHDRLFAYATGNDTDWQIELGFQAVKLACPYGPTDGLRGLELNEQLISQTRKFVGDSVEIMLDCYMAFDVDYTIRLARRLRPYQLKWIEEYLIPEDIDGHVAVRRAVNWVSLASGEHLFTRWPYQQLIEKRALDILQPDIFWVGGLSECVKICHMASAAGLQVILHGGGNSPYGVHLSYAMPNMPWVEYFIGSPPGVPLEETKWIPGATVPEEGFIKPSEAPGFGLEIDEAWLVPYNR